MFQVLQGKSAIAISGARHTIICQCSMQCPILMLIAILIFHVCDMIIETSQRPVDRLGFTISCQTQEYQHHIELLFIQILVLELHWMPI